jgi:rod shape-determining protein MreC
VKAKTTGTYVLIALVGAVTLSLVLFRSLAVEAAYPFERARLFFSRSVWSRVTGMFNGASASAENIMLRREVAALALVRSDSDRLAQENARLRRALGYAEKNRGSWIPAAVLSRNGGAAGSRQTIRVDKGSLAGIREGAVVSVPEGLVGKVVLVTPHTSEVLLVTDPSLKVACEICVDEETKVRGILSGGSDDVLLLKHLRGAENVPARSVVLTSGLGGSFPKGIEVGSLLEVQKDANGPAYKGEVLPRVEYSILEDVFIRCEK